MDKYLTTTQAVKFCNVTRFTIINWVKSGKLKSDETAGGHRRILKEDLIKFIEDNKIAEIGNKHAKYLIPRCWEFRGFKRSGEHHCLKCLVFKEKAEKCFLLVKKFGSNIVQCNHDCLHCKYLLTYYPKAKTIISKMKTEAPKGKSKPLHKPNTQPHCWEYKDFINSKNHDCSNCLVFKQNANKCFLIVKEFGSEQRGCKYDCLQCKYLLNYYPKEKSIFKKNAYILREKD